MYSGKKSILLQEWAIDVIDDIFIDCIIVIGIKKGEMYYENQGIRHL